MRALRPCGPPALYYMRAPCGPISLLYACALRPCGPISLLYARALRPCGSAALYYVCLALRLVPQEGQEPRSPYIAQRFLARGSRCTGCQPLAGLVTDASLYH